jgi:hypothetical protein
VTGGHPSRTGLESTTGKLATVGIVVMLSFTTSLAGTAFAASKFQKLTGPQIHAKLSGMEVSDEVHWTEFFAPNGTLTSYSMSRKTTGKWRVEKDELCLDRATKDDSGCFQVWLFGNKVELKRAGSEFSLEGMLRRPVAHN